MRQLCLFVLILLLHLSLGCAADGQKGQWDEFWKDVRGENMEMKGFRNSGNSVP